MILLWGFVGVSEKLNVANTTTKPAKMTLKSEISLYPVSPQLLTGIFGDTVKIEDCDVRVSQVFSSLSLPPRVQFH